MQSTWKDNAAWRTYCASGSRKGYYENEITKWSSENPTQEPLYHNGVQGCISYDIAVFRSADQKSSSLPMWFPFFPLKPISTPGTIRPAGKTYLSDVSTTAVHTISSRLFQATLFWFVPPTKLLPSNTDVPAWSKTAPYQPTTLKNHMSFTNSGIS